MTDKELVHYNKQQFKKRLSEIKEASGCMDCGETNPIVLEFDHINSKEKSFNISNALMTKSYVSWEFLFQEIEKCDIRCANCHRIKTAKDYGFWKFKLLSEEQTSQV